MKKILCIIIFLGLVSGVVFAQSGDTWFLGKPIIDFEFIGLQAVSEQEVRAIIQSYLGKEFTYDLYWEIQNRLYALEYFESVAADAVEADDTKTSVIIRFTVKERAIVSAIRYKGNSNLSDSDLNDVVLSKTGSVFNEPLIKKDIEAIVTLYRSKGFLDTAATHEIVKKEKTNETEIIFTINEGPKSTVKKIQFSGNSFASEGTLKGLMKTREPALFVSGDFIESLLQEDVRAISEYYGENGYVKAVVDKIDRQIEINEKENRKYIILTLYITEGTQYTFGGITVSGNKVFDAEQILGFFRQKSGDIFSGKKFKEDFQKCTSLYYNNGYVTTQIVPQDTIDEGKKEISFEIKITEGDRSHIGKVIIQGNTKTKESIIRRELPFEEGDVFNVAKIQMGYMNLLRTGFFSRNTLIEPVPGSAEGLIDVIITVEEERTAQIEVGGTIMPGDFPVSLYGNLYDKNFLGAGVTTGINLNVTPIEQGVSLFYQDNWMFNQRITGGINLSFKHEEVQNVPQDILWPMFNGDEDYAAPDPFNSWDEYEAAIANGQGIPEAYLMKYDSVKFILGLIGGYGIATEAGLISIKAEPSMTISYVTWDPSINRPFSNLLRSELDQWQFINRLGITLTLNNLDIPSNPETGYFLSQYVGFTGAFLSGSRHYTRLITEAEVYVRLFDIPVGDDWRFKWIMALHSQVSFLLPPVFGDKVSVEEDNYRIDGMQIGRGWWSLRFRGEAMWDNKFEIRMPLIEDGIWWTVFFADAVALWPTVSDMTEMQPEDFYFSFGTGLRITVPGLPIRLYFAKRGKFSEGQWEWQQGGITFWDGFDLDFVFAVDINPF
ncbi:MAG: outer membrane protein assembly factor BamA [Spirochaetales bacterium]|nr:outer membrane protein assembly factor BamA [Spirochaetales bacterium]